MSYCRLPFYIWNDCEKMHFISGTIDEEEINVLLYKILLTPLRDELAERIQEGRKILFDFHEKDAEYLKWMEDREDEFVKELLARETQESI